MNDFIAIDFETANRNLSSVCSVGIVIVRNGDIVEKLYYLIHPYPNYYNFWNTAVHGLNRKDTELAPDFPEIWREIVPKINGLPFVAHNSSFDEACLKAVLKAYSMPCGPYRFYCTYRMARRKWKKLLNYKLPTVAAYCGYDLRAHHHALSDAEACATIAMKLYSDFPKLFTD